MSWSHCLPAAATCCSCRFYTFRLQNGSLVTTQVPSILHTIPHLATQQPLLVSKNKRGKKNRLSQWPHHRRACVSRGLTGIEDTRDLDKDGSTRLLRERECLPLCLLRWGVSRAVREEGHSRQREQFKYRCEGARSKQGHCPRAEAEAVPRQKRTHITCSLGTHLVEKE